MRKLTINIAMGAILLAGAAGAGLLTACQEEISAEKPAMGITTVGSVTETTAVANASVVSDGGEALITRGICWNTKPNPTFELSTKVEEKNPSTGEFSAQLNNLTHNTNYYVRSYARNKMGATYSEEVIFTTLRIYGTPIVDTTRLVRADTTTAVVSGKVLSDEGKPITMQGICYSSTEEQPFIETSPKELAGTDVSTFICTLTGLDEGTTYYARAFATNELGTTYGVAVTFSTKSRTANKPTVTTMPTTTKTLTNAMLTGKITSTGGADITKRGVSWSINRGETLPTSDTLVDYVNSAGEFKFSVKNLTPDTTYYFVAFAENAAGITYSAVDSFRTDKGGELVLVTGGTFQMGAAATEIAATGDNDQGAAPKHSVMLSSYQIGKYEVTLEEYCEFLNATSVPAVAYTNNLVVKSSAGDTLFYIYTGTADISPKHNGTKWEPSSPHKPMAQVTWRGAKKYCEWKTTQTGKTYRLPTEAEWEFAARGGTQSQGYRFSGSNDSIEVAVFGSNTGAITFPGTKKPNELGIYDMSGHLWEFVSDLAGTLYYSNCNTAGTVTNPKGPVYGSSTDGVPAADAALGSFRIRRGGAYDASSTARYRCMVNYRWCKVTTSTTNTETGRQATNGFRVVVEVP